MSCLQNNWTETLTRRRTVKVNKKINDKIQTTAYIYISYLHINTYWYFLCSPPGDLGQTVVSPPSAPSAGNPPVDINAHQRPLMTKKAKVLYNKHTKKKIDFHVIYLILKRKDFAEE